MKKNGNEIDKIKVLLSLGVSKTEIAKQIGVSRQGLHKYLVKNADKLNDVEIPKSLSKYVGSHDPNNEITHENHQHSIKPSTQSKSVKDLGALDTLLAEFKNEEV